jgi:hypothetical protein
MSPGVASALRIAAALAALVVAAVVAVAAEDARRWPENLRLDDVRFRAAPERADWGESQWFGADAVRSLLGLDDDLEFRRLVAAFHRQREGVTETDAVARLQAQAQLETALRAIERGDSSTQRRARAANMLGVLSFDAAISTPRGAQSLLDQTVGEFRTAIRIDPREEEAKFNLELLLELVARGDLRSTAGRGGVGGQESEAGGAGLTDPGHGY